MRLKKKMTDKKEQTTSNANVFSDALKIHPSIICYHNESSPITENFRTLRTNLKTYFLKSQMDDIGKSDDYIFDDSTRIINICSANSFEGKSITANNLACILAKDMQSNVLLINADLRNNNPKDFFKGETPYGLSDILSEKCELTDCIYATQMKGLFFMPRGNAVTNPSELLGSLNMRYLLNQLKHHNFSYILIDVPPILEYTDAAIVGNMTAGTLFVTRASKTYISSIKKSITLFEHAHVKMIGFVMTYADQL